MGFWGKLKNELHEENLKVSTYEDEHKENQGPWEAAG